MELCARKDVPEEQKWDLSLIFPEEKEMIEFIEQWCSVRSIWDDE